MSDKMSSTIGYDELMAKFIVPYGNDVDPIFGDPRIETAPVVECCENCKWWMTVDLWGYGSTQICKLAGSEQYIYGPPMISTATAYCLWATAYLLTKPSHYCNQWKVKEEQK